VTKALPNRIPRAGEWGALRSLGIAATKRILVAKRDLLKGAPWPRNDVTGKRALYPRSHAVDPEPLHQGANPQANLHGPRLPPFGGVRVPAHEHVGAGFGQDEIGIV
jgi:hypothetical protein